MKSIPMDFETVGLAAAAIGADFRAAIWDGTNVSGPDDLMDRVAVLDMAALRKAGLLAYAASRRYAVETGGITVGAIKVATDRESQAMLNAAYNLAQGNSQFSTMWKGTDGTFSAVDAAAIIALAQAVGAFVAQCFAAEASVVNSINAGSITTKAQVDNAIAV